MKQMSRSRYFDCKGSLIRVLMEFAPNADAVDEILDIVRRIEIENEDYEEADGDIKSFEIVLKTLAGMLHNGLSDGNWPWNLTYEQQIKIGRETPQYDVRMLR